MKHSIKQFALTVLVALVSFTASAYDFEMDGIYYNILTDSTVEVTSSEKYSGDISIPASVTYNGTSYSVTEIGTNAFSGCNELTSISIPKSITVVESYAFNKCTGLKGVYITDLRAWCNILFDNKDLSSNPLFYAHNLYIDGKLTTNLDIPKNVWRIKDRAFVNCTCLIEVNFPVNFQEIGFRAFQGCSSIRSINLPDRVTYIGAAAFLNCKSLTSINIPDMVTWIGTQTFSGCSSLTSITIPDGVTTIEDFAFSNCSSLTSITIPDGVTSIASCTFRYCSSLESITIGSGVTNIGEGAFSYCKKIKEIYSKSETPPTCESSNTFNNVPKIYSKVYVPEVSVEKYKEAFGWNEFMNIVGIDMGNTDADEKCDAPTITYNNSEKKLKFSCNTQGANYIYSISSDDIVSYTKSDGDVPLTGIYTITAYATTDDKQKSETVTAKLVWVNAEIDNTGTDVISAKTQRGVVVSTQNGNIVISGTVGGETINVYNAAGSLVKSVKAQGDSTVIGGLTDNSVYIVKIGGTSVKVLVSE